MPDWQVVLRFKDPDPDAPEPLSVFLEVAPEAMVVEKRADAAGKRVTYFIMPDGSAAAFVEQDGDGLKMTMTITSPKAQKLAEGFRERYPEAEIKEADQA